MRRLPVLAMTCMLLLAACASDDVAAPPAPTPEAPAATPDEPGEDPTATEPESPRPDPETPRDGAATTPEALDFGAPLVGGGTFDGSDYDGRDVALWFWAPW